MAILQRVSFRSFQRLLAGARQSADLVAAGQPKRYLITSATSGRPSPGRLHWPIVHRGAQQDQPRHSRWRGSDTAPLLRAVTEFVVSEAGFQVARGFRSDGFDARL